MFVNVIANIKPDTEESKSNVCNSTPSSGAVTDCIKSEDHNDSDCKCVECLGLFISGERTEQVNKSHDNQADNHVNEVPLENAQPDFDPPIRTPDHMPSWYTDEEEETESEDNDEPNDNDQNINENELGIDGLQLELPNADKDKDSTTNSVPNIQGKYKSKLI